MVAADDCAVARWTCQGDVAHPRAPIAQHRPASPSLNDRPAWPVVRARSILAYEVSTWARPRRTGGRPSSGSGGPGTHFGSGWAFARPDCIRRAHPYARVAEKFSRADGQGWQCLGRQAGRRQASPMSWRASCQRWDWAAESLVVRDAECLVL